MGLVLVLLAGALGIVGYGVGTGGGFSARIAKLVKRTSRSRMILAWSAGTAVTYGLFSLVALALLGRLGDVATMPVELRVTAWRLGLPAAADGDLLLGIALCLGLGAALGIAILLFRRWRGKKAIGLAYRSPAAARERAEVPAAASLALSAGISEELFFRLLLPLLAGLASGSMLAGLAVGLAAFAALHRHQGWAGVVAVTLIGLALTYLYLLTGALWLVMLLHVLIDLNALILRPALTARPLSS